MDRNQSDWNEYLRSVDDTNQYNDTLSMIWTNSQDDNAGSNDDDAMEYAPDSLEMLRRLQRRQNIIDETTSHRSLHEHEGLSDTNRNVMLILRDRQIYGSKKITFQQNRNTPNQLLYCRDNRSCRRRDGGSMDDDEDDPNNKNGKHSRLKDGERSPSTVFDSPISTATQMPDDNVIQLTPHQQQQRQRQAQHPFHHRWHRMPRSLNLVNDRHYAHRHDVVQTLIHPVFPLANHAISQDDDIVMADANEDVVNDDKDIDGHDDLVNSLNHSSRNPQPGDAFDSSNAGLSSAVIQPTSASTMVEESSSPVHDELFNQQPENNEHILQLKQQLQLQHQKLQQGASPSDKYRTVTYPLRVSNEIRMYGEYSLATKYHSSFLNHLGGNDIIDENGNRPISSNAVSTISIAFSVDGLTMASTHGDHTVKITCCVTGKLLQSLDGHPRTPWTVKYSPLGPHIVASGCLGQQVRVWNWSTKTCLQMIRLEFAIISLSFHPSGKLLAIANGTRLHFWSIQPTTSQSHDRNSSVGIAASDSATQTSTTNRTDTNNFSSNQINSNPLSQPDTGTPATTTGLIVPPTINRSSTAVLTELDQRHMLRCVHFPPNGTTLIIGGVNPQYDDPRSRQQPPQRNRPLGANGMSFYLRMWDFDIDKALEPHRHNIHSSTSHYGHNSMTIRKAISNPRTFVPRALLYNDGGFDVSPDGRKLCACAEYWLPDGVNNVNDLLRREERAYEDEILRKEDSESLSNDKKSFAANSVFEYGSTVTLAQNTAITPLGPVEPSFGDDEVRVVGNHTASTATFSSALHIGTSTASTLLSTDVHNASVAASLSNIRSGYVAPNAYFTRLKSSNTRGTSSSFRDGMEHPLAPGTPASSHVINQNLAMNSSIAPRTPAASSPEHGGSFIPLTPPITIDHRLRNLSPPPPPGSQSMYGRAIGRRQTVNTMGMEPLPPPSNDTLSFGRGLTTAPQPPPPAPPAPVRPPHPLSFIPTSVFTGVPISSVYTSSQSDVSNAFRGGRYVPHVVTVSLDTDPFPESFDAKLGRGKPYGAVAKGYQPRLGQLLEACPLDANKASAVTCVKFSPSTDFCLIGYGVREPIVDNSQSTNGTTNNANSGSNARNFHPVTAIYRIRGGMSHVSTMLSGDDDVNIARFHPDSGHSFVYGTKQGRVRVLSKRPWNFYDS